MTAPFWSPPPERIANSALREYLSWLERREGTCFCNHDDLWAWSVDDVDRFWISVIDYFGVEFVEPWTLVRTPDAMPNTRWFCGGKLNWAQEILRRGPGDAPALVCVREDDGLVREIDFAELRRSVAAVAGWLRRAGVRAGDRVSAYLPNTEHAVIGCLASAAIGAVWSCCPPDFGAEGAIARLAQLEPTVLIASDGYHWNGKTIDRSDVVGQLQESLPTLRHVVHVDYAFDRPGPAGSTPWGELLRQAEPLTFEPVEFSHPLWVLFTSGTTGPPKGLVHGHGGIALEAVKWSGLYAGLRPRERMFAVTSTGWALWNMQLGALSQGAAIVLYEGSPSHPAGVVWDIAENTRADVVLLGAAVVTAGIAAGVEPQSTSGATRVRHVMVSGSALPAVGYRWLTEHLGHNVRVDSTSGGTDISGSFVGGNEYAPVQLGRIGGRLAGVDCAAWNDRGESVIDTVGDLVITQPMPSMPICLWNDPTGDRYLNTYFDTWPGVWRHGDWVTMHSDGSVSIHGRSDSTLNRHGVRLGSSDFYEVLEAMAEVSEALVVGVDLPDGGYWLGVFVVPADGHRVEDGLRAAITTTLRNRLSPRHVPDEIVEAPAIPRTLTGKRIEVPVKKLLSGAPLQDAVTWSSVDNPSALSWFIEFAADRLTWPGWTTGTADLR
ncbi:acetoacetate--CoA ligase [Mycobacterium sp. NPDC003449]